MHLLYVFGCVSRLLWEALWPQLMAFFGPWKPHMITCKTMKLQHRHTNEKLNIYYYWSSYVIYTIFSRLYIHIHHMRYLYFCISNHKTNISDKSAQTKLCIFLSSSFEPKESTRAFSCAKKQVPSNYERIRNEWFKPVLLHHCQELFSGIFMYHTCSIFLILTNSKHHSSPSGLWCYSPIFTSWHVINNTWDKQIPSHTDVLRRWSPVIVGPGPCRPEEVESVKITAFTPPDARSTREHSCQPLHALQSQTPDGSWTSALWFLHPTSHLLTAKITPGILMKNMKVNGSYSMALQNSSIVHHVCNRFILFPGRFSCKYELI